MKLFEKLFDLLMKLFDKIIKPFKTDRNTFLTYILTVLTIYIIFDRIVEMLLIFFTGISVSYWGPIQYTLALACPIFAFFLSFASEFTKAQKSKLSFFYLYFTSLYIIGISALVQWLNSLGWILLLSLPNYVNFITEFSDLIKPAFISIALYIPLTTFFKFFKLMYLSFRNNKDIKDSIMDYEGIDLTPNKDGTGPYSCEITICKDVDSGKLAKVPEQRRFESSLIMGVSGSGKTSMVFEPMMARDLEKKYFFKEISKELGYTSLKTGIATLNCPYDNTYINENFNLNMLTPAPYKEKLYQAYFKEMIYGVSSNEDIIFKDLGITSISPDYESISHIIDIAKNYNIPVNVVDPKNPNSIGMNPFTTDDAAKAGMIISSIIRGMYAENHTDYEESFKENIVSEAIENLCILLKLMYPKLHNGDLPNIEDLNNMLNNFSLIEEMCEELKQDEELKERFKSQIVYFEKFFYKNSEYKKETEKYMVGAITMLDRFLRYPSIKDIIGNRTHNINFDKCFANGEVTLICTRRGDLGAVAHKSFGMFFILLMQFSVLARPGNEKTRIPHFLYIDEFPDFLCRAVEPIFTIYRKYRVGTIISAQNLAQFGESDKARYRQTILANCTTKMIFGNNTPEDNLWWQEELGRKRDWLMQHSYNTDDLQYDQKKGNVTWGWKYKYEMWKVQDLKFKECFYKTKNSKGKNVVGQGRVDFVESKYKSPHDAKLYSFDKFTPSMHEKGTKKKEKFVPRNISFEEQEDPIMTDTTDASYLFNNEDAISFNLNTKKNNS